MDVQSLKNTLMFLGFAESDIQVHEDLHFKDIKDTLEESNILINFL